MFAHFGHKWACLHRGPCWQYEIQDISKIQQEDYEDSCKSLNILESALEMSGIDLTDECTATMNQLENGGNSST